MTLAPANPDHLTQREIEQALWAAANALRGPVDAGDFKAYVFPLVAALLSPLTAPTAHSAPPLRSLCYRTIHPDKETRTMNDTTLTLSPMQAVWAPCACRARRGGGSCSTTTPIRGSRIGTTCDVPRRPGLNVTAI